jgi:rhodanese-related sulfurtransferase
VRIVFKHYPLPNHANALDAAKAAECARQQGRFWEMARVLYKNQKALRPGACSAWARSLGLDMARFEACMADPETEAHITRDVTAARDAGIMGTPAFVINGRLYMGARSFDELKRLIDAPVAASRTAVSAREARELIGSGRKDLVILDVRTPAEFSGGHIAGAVNIDVKADDFLARTSKMRKIVRYLVYCRSGTRSAKALELMSANGFTDLTELSGGVMAWSEEGLPLSR